MADPDEALIEAIAEVILTHNIACTGLGEVTCRGCRELGWMSWSAYRKHVARAVVAHLGLVEQVRYVDFTPTERRLVSRWTEVEP